jgi:hypothetical protein
MVRQVAKRFLYASNARGLAAIVIAPKDLSNLVRRHEMTKESYALIDT